MRFDESDGRIGAGGENNESPRRALAAGVVSRTFRFGSTAVAVETADGGALAWLEEFLVPPFVLGGAAASFVHLTADQPRYDEYAAALARALARDAPFFRLDREIVSLPSFPAGGGVVAFDAKYDCFYDVSPPRVAITARPGATVHRGGVMRIVREIVSVAAVAAGGRILHAGALAFADDGVAIAGPKAAGKSTLLCYLAGAAGARLLANDRVLVERGAGGLTVTGMPTVVGLRPGTLAAFPALAAGVPRVPRPSSLTGAELSAASAMSPAVDPRLRLRLSPAELARRLGVQRAGRASLRAVVFPETVDGAGAPVIERLDPAAAVTSLERSRFSAGTDGRATLFEGAALFAGAGLGERGRAHCDEGMVSLAAIAATTPCFRFRAGLDAYASPDARERLLDAVLHARPQ